MSLLPRATGFGVTVGLLLLAPPWGPPGAGRAWALGSGATTIEEVAVVSPPAADALLGETVSRLRSELGAMGLGSHLVSCTDDVAVDARACEEARAALRAAAPPPSPAGLAPAAPRAPSALVSLAREDGVVMIEVIERLSNGAKFFRLVYVPVRDGGKDPAVLAIRGVELLRDLHMDVERAAAMPVAPPRSEASRGADVPEPDRRSERASDRERELDLEPERHRVAPPTQRGPWQIGLALAALVGRGGLGPSVGAALGGGFAATRTLSAFALVSGPFSDDLRASFGTATARQELALVGVSAGLPFERVRPYGAAALGVLHVKAEGTSSTTDAPTRASSLWAALLSIGLGGRARVTSLVDIGAEVDMLWAAPSAAIDIAGEVAGRAGAPSFLAQTGVWVTLP